MRELPVVVKLNCQSQIHLKQSLHQLVGLLSLSYCLDMLAMLHWFPKPQLHNVNTNFFTFKSYSMRRFRVHHILVNSFHYNLFFWYFFNYCWNYSSKKLLIEKLYVLYHIEYSLVLSKIFNHLIFKTKNLIWNNKVQHHSNKKKFK